jgi:hypothetical protein
MTLEQLNIIVQVISTLGVVGSLIFVGRQVWQNTKATCIQDQENVTSDYTAVAKLLVDTAGLFTRGIAATRESFAHSPMPKR